MAGTVHDIDHVPSCDVPDVSVAHNGLGLIAADANHTDAAAREFERATALDPNNASYWANLGNARRSMRDSSFDAGSSG